MSSQYIVGNHLCCPHDERLSGTWDGRLDGKQNGRQHGRMTYPEVTISAQNVRISSHPSPWNSTHTHTHSQNKHEYMCMCLMARITWKTLEQPAQKFLPVKVRHCTPHYFVVQQPCTTWVSIVCTRWHLKLSSTTYILAQFTAVVAITVRWCSTVHAPSNFAFGEQFSVGGLEFTLVQMCTHAFVFMRMCPCINMHPNSQTGVWHEHTHT